MDDVKLIAFYLPQFHPIEENNAWWGKGFTEWTNVTSAKPVFPGHYQPHLPADLGFYDLRLAEVREEQARLARDHGIHGFCYYYYYFNGKRLLQRPLEEVLVTGKPDLPFCVCWANENWTRRWDGRSDEILIEQAHSHEDDQEFIRQLAPLLKDRRYIRIGNKLLLLVYRTELIPNPEKTSQTWRKYIKKTLGEELFLCAVNNFVKDIDPGPIGFDAIVQFPLSVPADCFINKKAIAALHGVKLQDIETNWFISYPRAVNHLVHLQRPAYKFFRGVFPSWDNTPRRKSESNIFLDSSPEIYKLYLKTVIGLTREEHTGDEQVVFINAWNEWAEGAYLEPDKKYGLQFLEATRDALREPGDVKAMTEEIKERDAESRRYYGMAGNLAERLSSSEERISGLNLEIEARKKDSGEKERVLNQELAEKDLQIRLAGKLLEQKELLALEKEAQLREKEDQLKVKDSQILGKDELIGLKDGQIREKDELLVLKDSRIREKEEQIRLKDSRLAEKDEQIRLKDEQVVEKDNLLREKDLHIDNLEARLTGAMEQIRELEVQAVQSAHDLSEARSDIEQLNGDRDRKEQVIATLERSLVENNAAIAARDKTIREHQITIASANHKLQNALHRINAMEKEIRGRDHTLTILRNSYSWRITAPVRWLHAALVMAAGLLFHAAARFRPRRTRTSHHTQGKELSKDNQGPAAAAVKPHGYADEKVRASFFREIPILERSRLFDKQWYLDQYPDIRKAGLDPVVHFLAHGVNEGRKPNPLFEPIWYWQTYPQVAKDKINPLVHYICHGAAAGFNPNPYFDAKWYLEQNPDVAKAGLNPLEHYLRFGEAERRNLLKPDTPAKLSLQNIKSVAVVCHVFYPELWDEISISIRNIPIPCELFISVPKNGANGIRKQIMDDFPNARIKTVANIGGDVYPFMLFLDEVAKAGHPLFCKIHTKKGITIVGDMWRNVMLSALLGGEYAVINILNAFDSDPALCMTGPGLLYKSAKALEYGNREIIERVHTQLYPGENLPDDWGFFAGTMFWGRTETFLPLTRTILRNFSFEEENQKVDGQLAHAFERLTGAVLLHEEKMIGLVTNELAITRSRKLEKVKAPGNPSPDSVDRTLKRITEMYKRAYPPQDIPVADPGQANHGNGILQEINRLSRVTFHRQFPFVRVNPQGHSIFNDSIPGGLHYNPRMQKILLCGHSAGKYLAGGEVSFLDMAQGLKNSGYNVIIVLPDFNPEYFRILHGMALKFYIIKYDFWGVSDEKKQAINKLIRIIRQEKISAVYINTIMVREPVTAARIAGVPSITHVRELIEGDDVLAEQIRLGREEIRQEVVRRSDYIVANSKATAVYFNKPGATFIIPNTIETGDFKIRNGIDIKNITVGLISSNIPKKGIYEFIEVARICEKEFPNVTFLMIGPETNFIRELKDKRQEDGVPDNIRFPGYCTRPVEAVAMANIIMNLSLFTESFGRTVLEAMAAGRPVVAYDNGAISELIREGENGFLVPYKDVVTAAERIGRLCRNPHQIIAMGEKGRKVAEEGYTKKIYDQSMDKVMKEILAHWHAKKGRHGISPDEETTGRAPAHAPKPKVSVSVIIPNYNYSNYLKERILSIANQTVAPAEIIFLDDASSDNSVEVAGALLKATGIPSKVLVNKGNRGTYHQWMKGIAESAGDFLWIAEADDSSSPRFLETMLRQMEADNVVMAYCQSRRLNESGELLAPNNLHHTDDLSKERWKHDYTEIGLREVVDYLVLRNSIPNVSACLIRKSALAGVPGEITGYRFVGDWLLYSYLLSKGSVAYVAETLNDFRRHGGSVTRSSFMSEEYLLELLKIKKFILREFPVHRSQIDRVVHFLNKDYKINGLQKNSDHPAVAEFIAEAYRIAAGRRRLVFLTTNNGSHNGGSEQLWTQTAAAARKQGHDVWVMIKKWDPAPYFFREFTDLGIKLLFKEECDFGDVVRFNPDLMVISTGDQDEGTEWYDKCRHHDIPYVIINQLTKEPEYWPIRPEKTVPVTKGYLGARRAFFTSHNNHRVMEKRLGCEIPNAGTFYQPFFIDRTLEIPFPPMEDGLHLALPSRLLTIHKGQHLAIEVANMEKWRSRKIFLNLYGVGPDEPRLRDLADKYGLNNVRFHQPKWTLPNPDLFDIWRTNHAILMPSFMEGMPLVVLNAMVCARVPIVTDVGGHREIIEDNVNGFIAAKPTVESLDEAMERAYAQAHRWEEIGKLARKTILEYLPEDPIAHFIGQLMMYAENKQ